MQSGQRRSIQLAEGMPPVFPLGSLDDARDATGLGMPDVPVAGQQAFQLNRKVGDLTSDLPCLLANLSHQGCIFESSLSHFPEPDNRVGHAPGQRRWKACGGDYATSPEADDSAQLQLEPTDQAPMRVAEGEDQKP